MPRNLYQPPTAQLAEPSVPNDSSNVLPRSRFLIGILYGSVAAGVTAMILEMVDSALNGRNILPLSLSGYGAALALFLIVGILTAAAFLPLVRLSLRFTPSIVAMYVPAILIAAGVAIPMSRSPRLSNVPWWFATEVFVLLLITMLSAALVACRVWEIRPNHGIGRNEHT